MKNILICFLNGFPYESVEEYFEKELPIASIYFDEVIIVTSGDPSLPSKLLPTNVSVINVDESAYKSKRASFELTFYYLRFLILDLIIFPSELFKKLKAILDYWKIFKIQYLKWQRIKNEPNFRKPNGYERVYFYDYWFANNYLIIKWWRKTIKSKTVFFSRAHRYDLYDEVWGAPLPFRNLLLNDVDKVFPCSIHGENYLLGKASPKVKHKIRYSYLGVSDEGVGKIAGEKIFTLVSCSSLLERKKVARIIDVLSLVTDIQFRWIHFGDGPLRDYLYKYAKEKLHQDQFQFMGYVDNNSLQAYYRDNPVDLFISMSVSEGLPVSMMEVTSFGIPVLAVDCMGVSEIVNEITGIVVLNGDENICIAEKLRKILFSISRDPDKREKIRAFSREKFSLENYREFHKKLLTC